MLATELKNTPPRILVFGDYGTGKTHLIGLLHNELLKRNTKGVRAFDFDLSHTWQQNKFSIDIGPKYAHYVNEGFDAFLNDFTTFEKNPQGFGGFAIDSLTSLQRVVMEWVHKKNPSKRPLGFLSSQQDWGILIEVFGKMMPQLQVISSHSMVIVTAHIRRQADSSDAKIEMPLPAIAGRTLPSSIGLWFTEVWKTSVEGTAYKPQYRIQTRPDSIYKCKTQIAEMPGIVDMDKAVSILVESIYGSQNIEKGENKAMT